MSEEQVWFLADEAQWSATITEIGSIISKTKTILLYGDLGSGKTTLVRHFYQFLGGVDPSIVTSPTFSIVNEYVLPDNGLIIHMDLYRLGSVEEIDHLGFWDFHDRADYLLIEWPELIEPYLIDYKTVRIDVEPDKHRKVVVL